MQRYVLYAPLSFAFLFLNAAAWMPTCDLRVAGDEMSNENDLRNRMGAKSYSWTVWNSLLPFPPCGPFPLVRESHYLFSLVTVFFLLMDQFWEFCVFIPKSQDFFLKQKQLKVSYEIFLSSRSFGFHIPTGGGRGRGGLSFLRPFYR